jgi:hypothetical protein
MNPCLSKEAIDAALEEDLEGGRADYLGEFRSDLETFLSEDAINSCVIPGRYQLPYVLGCYYVGFTDPAGGSGKDSMTLAIAHEENDTVILDLVREQRPPFSPDAVTEEFCEILKSYHCQSVTGDRYGGEWCQEAFKSRGIMYNVSDKSKSDIYRELPALVNTGRCELLDDSVLINQLTNLERRAARGGRDSIDHPVHGKDDVCNAVAGAFWLAARESHGFFAGCDLS